MKKQMLMILIVIGMLISTGGCLEGLMPTWKYPCIRGTWAEQEDTKRDAEEQAIGEYYQGVIKRRKAQKKVKEEEKSRWQKGLLLLEAERATEIAEYRAMRNRLNYVEKYIALDMAATDVRSIFGAPDDINRSTGHWGIHEQWVYRDEDVYFYFENGILTSWQD